MLARHRKHEPGEHGPAASRQAGSSVGGNIHMKKAPDRRAPRITPAEQGPHKERSGARVAGHDQQSRGEQMPGAGNAPRTSVSERIKHIMPAHLAKLTAAVCRSSLPRPRCLPSLIIRWTGHVPGFNDLDTCCRTEYGRCISHTRIRRCPRTAITVNHIRMRC